MIQRLVRFGLALGLSLLASAGIVFLIELLWGAIGGGAMSLHGWIALTLGLTGTVGLTWLLMGLAFHSHRAGYDDRVDNSLDPGKDRTNDPGARR